MRRTAFQLPQAARQQGVVLIMGLVILLVMTIIGVAAMSTTNLEQKMATNFVDKNYAFQAAEAALRAGEEVMAGAETPTFDGTGGYFPSSTDGSMVWHDFDWTQGIEGPTLEYLAEAPRYIIEELPEVPLSATGSSMVIGFSPPNKTRFYRVTARGVGATDTAEVILQSTYKR